MEIDEATASLVQQAAALFLETRSMMAVQRFFDERGFQRAGGALRRGLASPQLAGIRIIDGVKISGTWPAILDVATHEAIVAELNRPERGRGRPAGSRWLLSGFTVCGRCGQPMRAGGHRNVKRSLAPTGTCRATLARVDLTKPHLDIGLYSADIAASRAFYEDVLGLPYEELLKAGGGIHQHRLGLLGGVLKLNASRDPLPSGLPTCLRGLTIASKGIEEPVEFVDPDGTPVTLTPFGRDVDTVEVRWASRSPRRLGELLALGLDARPVGADRWRVGSTVLQLVGDPRAEHAGGRGCGFRYLTVQVRDVVTEHIRLCQLGWGEEAAPIRRGDVAAISFVRDPDGTLLEVSQRASLTGPLPDH